MLNTDSSQSSNRQIYGLLGAGLLVYVALSILAGMPSAANLTAFIIGLVVLFVVVIALFAFSWYLLYKPLPAHYKIESTSPLSRLMRQGLAMLMVLSSLIGTAGGLWDVAWHTYYGLPFGPDFLWRPHQLIYFSLFAPILIAAFIWIQTVRKGKGTLQQRFRADKPLSILMLGGLFMLVVLPMDPIWHLIYAEDLTGLSVPHTLFTLANTVIFTGYWSILLSYTPLRQNWEGIWKARIVEFLIALIGATTLVTLLIVVAGDWEMVMTGSDKLPNLPSLVSARPDWALVAMLSFASAWVSSVTQYSSRLYGIASLSMILGIVIRQSLFIFFNNAFEGYGTWLVLSPLIISLDVLAWLGAKRGGQFPFWQRALVLTLFGTLITLPLINVFFSYPTVTLSNAPILVIAMFISSCAGLWMGQVLGNFIANAKREEDNAMQGVILPSVLQIAAVALLVFVLFTIWFVTSSVAPTI